MFYDKKLAGDKLIAVSKRFDDIPLKDNLFKYNHINLTYQSYIQLYI